MSAKLFQLKSYFLYWLDAVDAHSLHSPFLFDFHTKVLKRKSSRSEVQTLKEIRHRLLRDKRIIHVTDLGAGSHTLKTRERKIADITRISTTPEKYSALYSRIINHYRCHNIIELGTSVGINTLYLARGNVNVTTFEGARAIARVAQQLFDENKVSNVRMIEGNINQTLPDYLGTIEKFDLAFVDANHRFDPTMKYLDMLLTKTHAESIIILDDIHYTPEMEKAWKSIQKHDLVYTTVDLYRCGLIFFNPALTKQNVVLQF